MHTKSSSSFIFLCACLFFLLFLSVSHTTSSQEAVNEPSLPYSTVESVSPLDTPITTGERPVYPWKCFGVPSDASREVCSGRGVCVRRDQCICKAPYAGERCELKICGDGMNARGCSMEKPAKSCNDVFSQDMPLLSGMYYIRMKANVAAGGNNDEKLVPASASSIILVYCDRGGYRGVDDVDGVDTAVADLALNEFGDEGEENETSVSHNVRVVNNDIEDTIPPVAGEGTGGDASANGSDANGKPKKDAFTKTSTTSKKVTIPIPRKLLKYALQPKVISRNKIVFLNARDLKFYERSLKRSAMTVWLLTSGGTSGKRVALNYSLKRIFETAWNMGIQVRIMSTHKFDIIVTEKGLEDVRYDGKPIKRMPDVIMPRLGAKMDYFGMSIVRHFDRMGVLVLNTHTALDISRDKLFSIQQFASHNFPIPKTMFVRVPVNISHIEKEFTYPFVLKKSTGTHGKGVMLIRNKDHVDETMSMVDNSKPMIIQEFISNSKGRDIRVLVVGTRAIGAMMRVAKKGFRSNYHQGGYVKPVKLTPKLEWLTTEAARIVGLDIAGVDLLIDKGTYRICEINASPGFQGFELATGVDVAKELLEYARLRANMQIESNRKVLKPVEVPVEVEHLTPKPPSASKQKQKVEDAKENQEERPDVAELVTDSNEKETK